MAEQSEFLLAVDEFYADKDAVEVFVNGDENTDVNTRLNTTYPSLKKMSAEVLKRGGIAERFKTLVDLQASALTDGQYALVADDTNTNNGIYFKAGGAWVKSKYDPARLLDDIVQLSDTNPSDIFKILDSNGQAVVKTTTDGKHYFVGLDSDLETELNTKAEIDRSNNYIFEVKDINGNTTLKQDANGNIHAPHIGNLTDFYNSVKAPPNFDWTKAVYKAGQFADNLLVKDGQAFRSNENILTPAMLDPYFSYTVSVLRIPSMIRIAKDKFLVPFEAREDWGDVGKNSCATCILTIDPETKEPAVSDIVAVHEAEVLEDTRTKRYMNPAAVQLDDGQTIIMTYLTSIEKDWHDLLMVKSTDNGKTWGEPVSIGSQVMQDNWVLPVTSSGGFVKQHTPHKGRIIMPFFIHVDEWVGANGRVGFIYSDNNGQTWSAGKLASYTSATENQVIEDYNGDLLMAIRVEEKETPRRFARYSWNLKDYIDIPVQADINNEPSQAGFYQGENKWDNTNGKILFSTSKWGWKHTTKETASLRRSGLLVCVSYDACESWIVYNYPEIDKRRMGYSNICPLDENHAVVTYESEGSNIACAIVSLKTIREGV